MSVMESPTTTRRRITPTARLVLPATASRPELDEARRKGIGSSDAPVIVGSASHGSIAEVFYEKAGMLPPERNAGEKAMWGAAFKTAIADVWADRACTQVRRVGLVAHTDEPWMLTSLDRLVVGCPFARHERKPCGLHIVTGGSYRIPDFSSGQLPAEITDQLLWKAAVTGFEHIHLMAVLGGNESFRYVVRRCEHEARVKELVDECHRFWVEHVVPKSAPAATGRERPDEMVELFRRLYRDRRDVVELDGNSVEVKNVLRDYETERLAESAGKRAKDEAKSWLLAQLGAAHTALVDGVEAYSYKKVAGRLECDYELLEQKHPEAYAECVSRGDDSWRLNIGKAFRLTEAEA